MKNRKTITILVILISIVSAFTTITGIFSEDGPGNYQYESIRGKIVTIYGQGVYQHMSADVAIQGIAQDYVTLFIGIPLLLFSLCSARRGSLRGRFLLAGTLGYFFVTFLFYTTMAMYNIMFLAFVSLLSFSFFALLTTLLSFDTERLSVMFSSRTPVKFAGGFLIFNTISIALLWLSIIIPPLIDGSVYPDSLDHYTTLIVQGMDLGLLLPVAFVSALLFIKRRPLGYLFAPTYLVFLSILMTALTAKIFAMALNGVNVVPAVFIIPVFNILSLICVVMLLKNINMNISNK